MLKQQSFHYGQIYVALSRVTSLERFYILGSFSLKSIIRASSQALEEYNRFCLESMLLRLNIEVLDINWLVITLINIRSFNKHAIDLSGRSLTSTKFRFSKDSKISRIWHYLQRQWRYVPNFSNLFKTRNCYIIKYWSQWCISGYICKIKFHQSKIEVFITIQKVYFTLNKFLQLAPSVYCK